MNKDPVALGERIVTLLEAGSFNTTYKHAVLLGLMDLCIEQVQDGGQPPQVVTTHQLAEKVVALYWGQVRPYAGPQATDLLTQGQTGQAHVRKSEVGAYQQDGTDDFDNRIVFQLDVAAQLIRLNGLLRPIIQHHWAEQVRRINSLERNQLEDFLFAGRSRTALTPLREGLRDIQDDRCFYCGQRIGAEAEVDHFIPWARFPDDSIQNLVLADMRCNNGKRDFLAATDHLERWVERLASSRHQELDHLAASKGWESDSERIPRVARALYLNLGPDFRLWRSRSRFEPVDHASLVRIFSDAAD